jgi:hypothetical protein
VGGKNGIERAFKPFTFKTLHGIETGREANSFHVSSSLSADFCCLKEFLKCSLCLPSIAKEAVVGMDASISPVAVLQRHFPDPPDPNTHSVKFL